MNVGSEVGTDSKSLEATMRQRAFQYNSKWDKGIMGI